MNPTILRTTQLSKVVAELKAVVVSSSSICSEDGSENGCKNYVLKYGMLLTAQKMKHAHIVSARIDSGFNTVQNHTVNTDVCCFIMKSQMALKNCDVNQPSRLQVESEELDTNKHKTRKFDVI